MKIIKTSDVKHQHLYALICGESGVGKTTLASTLPPGETLIISAEAGLLSLKGSEIDATEVESFDDVVAAFNFLKKGSKYKHVLLDSLTEIGELIFNEIKPNYTKAQTFALYSDYSEKMIKLLKAFRNLTDYNIYFLALDKMTAKDFTEVVTIDLIQKSLSKKVPAYFDLVLHYVKETREDGTVARALVSDSDTVDFTKDRSGKLEKYEKPHLGDIYNKIFKEK